MSGTLEQNVNTNGLNVDHAVRERYSAAANAAEAALCCPIDYNKNYLKILPQEIIDRDYGCGDPSKYVNEGETVLDLGSGGGKICYIASQVVGPKGKVIGVDCNDEMLDLARKYQHEISEKIGYSNVEFRKGKIQDLKLDLDRLDTVLNETPINNSSQWLVIEAETERLRNEFPLIPDNSVDVVVSNCVLNLVKQSDRLQLFREIFRVLKRGGRAVISDITADEPIPEHLRNDPTLWSGCLSGAFVEAEFPQAFEEVGFYGVEVLSLQSKPWQVVEGIEFRSMTVQAYKGKEGPCIDRRQAVIYTGPWKQVTDDDGHTLNRGERTAVCEKTYKIYSHGPYAEQIIPVPPAELPPLEESELFDCMGAPIRDPKETKMGSPRPVELPVTNVCDPSTNCC